MEEINTVRHVVKLLLTINKFINKRDMIFYTTNDGQVKIEVRLEFIKKELDLLNRLVSAYLDVTEI